MPSANHLMQLSHRPATIVALGDIAIVSLERVAANKKNFDVGFVVKVRGMQELAFWHGHNGKMRPPGIHVRYFRSWMYIWWSLHG